MTPRIASPCWRQYAKGCRPNCLDAGQPPSPSFVLFPSMFSKPSLQDMKFCVGLLVLKRIAKSEKKSLNQANRELRQNHVQIAQPAKIGGEKAIRKQDTLTSLWCGDRICFNPPPPSPQVQINGPTGFDVGPPFKTGSPVQIGMVRVRGGRVDGTFAVYMNPGEPLSSWHRLISRTPSGPR